ncbi:MAG TPA: DUF4126 family protein [Thermomicrobiales bacterium]|nr:DUF4126 family protein [Thermomicrobiales bacterium]
MNAVVYARAGALGFVAGLRSMTPLACLAFAARHGRSARLSLARRHWPRWLTDRRVATLLEISAAGELVMDKMPSVPPRIERGPLIGRAVLGGLAGGIVAGSSRASVPVGTMLGAIGAVAGSYGGYYARSGIKTATGLPDLPVALGEDTVAIVLGIATTG